MYVRSSAVIVPLDDCTASSRMRWSMLTTSFSAPSAVEIMLMPSFAFLTAISRPLICDVNFAAMASPAASSAAELILLPVESFSMAAPSALSFLARAA